jgi:hypothetical protein
MPGMDAIALLENLGVKVKAVGMGKVKTILQAGQDIIKHNYNIRIIVIILKTYYIKLQSKPSLAQKLLYIKSSLIQEKLK